MKKKALLLFLIFLRMSSVAQLENIPLVTVYGESKIKVKPDHVILGIKILKRLPSSMTESSTALEIFKTEDTKIRLFGFDPKNMSETIIQADSGTYIKEVFITINDLNTLDKYLLELNKLGFRDYIYMDYRVKELGAYKNQARREAMNSAKKKAAALAAEVGQNVGKAHRIDELNSEDYNWYTVHEDNHLERVTFKLGADGYAIEPGFLVLTARVRVSFDLIK